MGKLITSLFVASDEQTMWRVKRQDDPQAFARLVARWEKPLQRLCAGNASATCADVAVQI